MDDIGTIVYVVAAIGYMVYRAFSGKKPKSQPRSEDAKQEGVTIEEILKQLGGQKEESQIEEPVAEVNEHKGHVHNPEPFLTVDAPPKPKRQYQMSSDEIKQHSRVMDRVEESKDKNHVDEVVEELSNGVDLRRAIIYQTILETPYLRQV